VSASHPRPRRLKSQASERTQTKNSDKYSKRRHPKSICTGLMTQLPY